MKFFLMGAAVLGLLVLLLHPRQHWLVSHSMEFASISEKVKTSTPQLRKPSANKVQPAAAPAENVNAAIDYLNQKTGQHWNFEKGSDHIVSFYGGVVKEAVNSDVKLKSFISELTQKMGYENVEFTEAVALKKESNLEVINEFHQSVQGREVYGAYFRAFRENENLGGTFFINEFKEYDQVNSGEAFTLDDVKNKLNQYYDRLGFSVSESACKDKVYFVKPDRSAELSYKCTVKTQPQTSQPLPQVFEVVVSLSSSDVLFQKPLTIFN